MLSRLFGRQAVEARVRAADAVSGFEVHSAVLDGRRTQVFVAPQGTAAAVEMGTNRASVLTGLAAGIVLSDVEEATSGPASSIGASSSSISQLSAREADELIDALPVLSDGQKGQLRAALSL